MKLSHSANIDSLRNQPPGTFLSVSGSACQLKSCNQCILMAFNVDWRCTVSGVLKCCQIMLLTLRLTNDTEVLVKVNSNQFVINNNKTLGAPSSFLNSGLGWMVDIGQSHVNNMWAFTSSGQLWLHSLIKLQLGGGLLFPSGSFHDFLEQASTRSFLDLAEFGVSLYAAHSKNCMSQEQPSRCSIRNTTVSVWLATGYNMMLLHSQSSRPKGPTAHFSIIRLEG